ncbi:unnamed protein product [Peniophora sp. CBMAI 1063]|nr:unnamed protein product [Peniophora sp. CBMAI 1063]
MTSITFYDLSRQGSEGLTDSERNWSPNTLKTRLALNIKGLSYKTEWLKFAEIAPKLESLGLVPTQPGPIAYTLPPIINSSSSSPRKKVIADSFAIAQYLDSAYPATHPLIPAGTAALQLAYIERAVDPLMRAAFAGLCRPSFERGCVDAADRAHYRSTREALFGGTSLEDIMAMMDSTVEGSYKAFDEALDGMARDAKAAGGQDVFIGGDGPWHVDAAIAGVLMSVLKMCGSDHALSKVIFGHEWACSLLAAFEKWA